MARERFVAPLVLPKVRRQAGQARHLRGKLVKFSAMSQAGEAMMEFEVDASLLINEGGLQCVPVVFARPRQPGPVELGSDARLDEARVASLDPARAAQRGRGLVAFILE